jgi:YVTN family beta-propeller protein
MQAKPSRRGRLIALVTAVVVVAVAVTAWLVYATNTKKTTAPTVIATVPVGKGARDVAVDPQRHAAYVTTITAQSGLAVIDIATNTVSSRTPVDTPFALALAPQPATAYVTGMLDKSLTVVDTEHAAVTDTIKLPESAHDVVVDPGVHRAYLTSTSVGATSADPGTDNPVTVVDTTNNTVTGTLHLGIHVGFAAVDPGLHTVYLTDYQAGTVSILDTTRNALAGSVQVGGNPGSLAVDTDTHRVYVINTKDRTVEVLGR